PTGLLSELYAVTTDRNSVRQVLTTPAPGAVPDKSFRKLFYYDIKGYENQWRKHHTSSVTRDIWQYETETGRHTRLTFFEGEDRNPVWSEDEQMLYYLSEQSGTFNVWKLNPAGGDPVQITHHTIHPVRFLSRAENGTLCYGYDGAIYTLKPGNEPQKLNITIFRDETADEATFESLATGATEMAVSPNGKEIAFVLRGDVFVTLIDYPTTRRITNTPQQERSI
ncbi:MAG: peptidase S41, partial [Phototrophicales bacterium]